MQKAAVLIFVIEDVKGGQPSYNVVWQVEPRGEIGIAILGLWQDRKAVLANMLGHFHCVIHCKRKMLNRCTGPIGNKSVCARVPDSVTGWRHG